MANEPFTVEYHVPAHGDIILNCVYTNSAASVHEWIDKVEVVLAEAKSKIIGTDVEFTPGSLRSQKAAVLQLCVGQDCLVYHISCKSEQSYTMNFVNFLDNWRYTFFGFDLSNDVVMLQRSLLRINRYKDIQAVWKDPNMEPKIYRGKVGKQGLKDIAGSLIHSSYKEMKGKMTNDDHKFWGIAPLYEKHMEHAAKDAYVAFELYKRLDFYERGRYRAMKNINNKRCREW
ncbi:unnamed protein product [Alopecurus aequalis]